MQNQSSISINLLDKVKSPTDIKNFSNKQLILLANEIRSFILDVVSVHPGHLGASLGVVELTVALHHVYNTPADKLIWDVGHQAYSHKIITGRKEQFSTLRQYNGISGFPNPEESEYDAFATGHASTSISAILGMAKAAAILGETDRKHIAVIGDGGITGGMAFEAFNNVGDTDILIILNDNGIAIDKNTGTIGEYLKGLTSKKDRVNLFEAMGIQYCGPVNGHDIPLLVKTLKRVKSVKGPKLLHVITTKGKGFKKAEQDQTRFHAPGQFDRNTGEIKNKKNGFPTYPEVFGKTLVELAEQNNKIIAVTPAMITGSSLQEFQKKYPKRIFDVGIAEQHAVTFSGGLAAAGLKPFCTIYSTFLQRAVDQVIHDVALQNLPVVFCIDRAGLVGGDGATHHGVFDLAFLNPVPNMVIAAPVNEIELRNMLFTAATFQESPFAIRYPRGKAINKDWRKDFAKIEIGKGEKMLDGEKIAILTIGHTGNYALEAAKILQEKSIYPAVFNMRFLKPIDEEILHEVFTNYSKVITVEDGTVVGGLGSAVVDFANKHNYANSIQKLGVPDRFVEHGSKEKLVELCGFSAKGIVENILKSV
jgi:1-deoxy-D-xylulose-5-phosphate synthase